MFSKKWGSTKPTLGSLLNYGNSLSKGLVACWTFNEGAGRKVYDLTGNKNIGTFTAGATLPTWAGGKFGPVISFAGDNAIQIASTPPILFAGNQPATLLAWIMPVTGIAVAGAILWSGTDEVLLRISAANTTGAEIVFNSFTTNDRVASGAGRVPLNEWTQVVGMYDGALISIYTNGVFRASVVPTGTYGTATSWGIAARAGSTNFFNGYIDHAMLFNRALSAQEVDLLYREPFAMFDRVRIIAPAAAPGGLIMPIAVHHLRQMAG